MNNFLLYGVIAFSIIIFSFIVIIWATVAKLSFPFLKDIWSPSKKGDENIVSGEKNHSPKYYNCEHCGANLGKGADVSPGGDIRCQYCNRWFNIHKNA